MLIVTREGDRKLRLSQRAMVALVYLRTQRPGKESPPGLLKVLHETDADSVLRDGTLAECDRGGDDRADYSHKHRRWCGSDSWQWQDTIRELRRRVARSHTVTGPGEPAS